MTEAINAANPYGATTEEVFGGETLTGEALMLYISARLSSLDEDINALMGQQQEAIAKKEYVHDFKDWAARVEEAKKSGDTELLKEVRQAHPKPPAGMEDLETELRQAYQDYCGKDKGPTPENIEAYQKKLDSVLDEINGASELNMIRLQQLMGQRQTCIQLTTNCMSKLSAGYDAIVGNFR